MRLIAPVILASPYAKLRDAGRLFGDAQLRQALNELDAVIGQTEKERSDALIASQVALQQIEQLIKEQKQLRDDTQRNVDTHNDDAAKVRSTPLSRARVIPKASANRPGPEVRAASDQ